MPRPLRLLLPVNQCDVAPPALSSDPSRCVISNPAPSSTVVEWLQVSGSGGVRRKVVKGGQDFTQPSPSIKKSKRQSEKKIKHEKRKSCSVCVYVRVFVCVCLDVCVCVYVLVGMTCGPTWREGRRGSGQSHFLFPNIQKVPSRIHQQVRDPRKRRKKNVPESFKAAGRTSTGEQGGGSSHP